MIDVTGIHHYHIYGIMLHATHSAQAILTAFFIVYRTMYFITFCKPGCQGG